MKHFLRANAAVLGLIILICAWIAWFDAWSISIHALPLDEKFSVTQGEPIDRHIKIPIPEKYELVLVFDRGNVKFEKLRELLGELKYTKDRELIPSGIRIPIKWSMATASDGVVVASGEINTFGSISWSAASAERFISKIHLPAGVYRFRAQILRGSPEFDGIETRLRMHIPPKAASTWQIGLAWWCGLINLFILWPTLIALLLLVGWRSLTYRSTRTPT
jgi:hypothetical protein